MYDSEQAKLYYLYMMSDGEISDDEKNLFNKICRKLYLDADDKKRIKQECNKIYKEEKMTCIDVIERNAEKSYVYRVLDIGLKKHALDENKAKIIWNLINLGYADSHFTIDEREVVDFLREYWEFPDSLYQEMIDVAETCLALEKHKLWIEGLPDTDYKLEKIKQVKKDMKQVEETILTTISEIRF